MPRRLTLVVLSAVLYILSFPKFNQAWVAWISLVPLSILARRCTTRQAFLWGWLSGILAYSGILYWIIVTFQAAHLSISLAGLCLLLLAGYLGLYWGAWAWFIQKVDPPLAGTAAWVVLEYVRTYLLSGFPWTLLADSQVKILPLIQIASITGVYGVSFLIVWFNLVVAQWRLKPLALSMMAVVLTCLFGYSRLKSYAGEPAGPKIRVALVQGSIDQYKKWDKSYVEDIEKTYEHLVSQAAGSRPAMIIWPETSVPGYLLQEPSLRSWLTGVVRNSHTSHLVGAPVIHNGMAYNSAFSFNPEGILVGEYAKQHLVPFGEVVPWSGFLGHFIRVLNDLGGFAAGTQPSVLDVGGGYPVGVNICYEAIFPDLVRRSVRQGARIIANLTNDGWYMQTAAPYQHWAPNIFRAVENNRWLVRADNTGISGIIEPTGRVQAASAIFHPAVIEGTVQAHNGLTFYTRYGDLFAWICVMFCTLICLRDILRQ